MLYLKKNGEQIWKPPQANKVYNALLVPTNIYWPWKRKKTYLLIEWYSLADTSPPSKSASRKEEVASEDCHEDSNQYKAFKNIGK